MARRITPLNAREVKAAKPREKGYKLFDGRGLFLWVDPSGGKLWRLKYKSPVTGKERTYSIGPYPDVSLLLARKRREELREMIARGIDPMETKKQAQAEKKEEERKKSETFGKIAEEYFAFIESRLSESHFKKQRSRIEKNVLPYIGETPITEVKRSEIIEAVKRIEERGAIETAHRVFSLCGAIFRFAVANEKTEHNIIGDIDKRNILQPSPDRNYPTITDPEEIGRLLRAIDGYRGEAVTRLALQLLPLLAVRPGNFRKAKWADIKDAQWVIPGEEMKVKRKKEGVNEYEPHVVPLSLQALKIIEELRMLTGESPYLFPSPLSKRRPMSDNTLNAALKRLGYKGQLTPHSFRAMFSTIAHENIHEHGFHSDIIERQLAHKEKNLVKAAYDRSEYLPQRRELMQWWADWLQKAKEN